MEKRSRRFEVNKIIKENLPDFFDDDECIDYEGLLGLIEDFLVSVFTHKKFYMVTYLDCSEWEGGMSWSEVTNFVLSNPGDYFLETKIDLINDDADSGVIDILIAGESFESIESKFKSKLVEFSTVRRVHEE